MTPSALIVCAPHRMGARRYAPRNRRRIGYFHVSFFIIITACMRRDLAYRKGDRT